MGHRGSRWNKEIARHVFDLTQRRLTPRLVPAVQAETHSIQLSNEIQFVSDWEANEPRGTFFTISPYKRVAGVTTHPCGAALLSVGHGGVLFSEPTGMSIPNGWSVRHCSNESRGQARQQELPLPLEEECNNMLSSQDLTPRASPSFLIKGRNFTTLSNNTTGGGWIQRSMSQIPTACGCQVRSALSPDVGRHLLPNSLTPSQTCTHAHIRGLYRQHGFGWHFCRCYFFFEMYL